MNNRALDEALAYLNGEPYENGYIYESLQDEFNLDLELLIAEREMINDLSGVFLESDSIEVLNEGIRETIMNYITKIVNGIQKAWDKFIAAFTNAELKHLKERIKPAIDKSNNINFTINNYKSYNMDKLKDFLIVPLDYDRMKDDLKSSEEFYRKYYPKLDMANSKNVKQAMEKALDKKIVNQPCDKKLLLDIYKFAAEDYFTLRDLIQNDIKTLNNTNENIKNIVNQIISSETPVNASYEFDIASTSIYLEADGESGDANGNEKTSFTDNTGETTKTDGSEQTKQENDNRKNITKAVTTYMSCSTKILSAKMAILNKQKRESFLILNHFYGSKKFNDTAVEVKNKANEVKSAVDTRINKK